MLAAGTWGEFVRLRKELRVIDKMDDVEAHAEALRRCVPGLDSGGRAAAGETGKVRVPPPETGACSAPDQSSPAESIGSLPALADVPGSVSLSAFTGKEANEVESIRWVARNMTVSGVRAEDCPDPAAWGLLAACREFPPFRLEFWKTMYTKILPTRSQKDGDTGRGEYDGQRQVELCDQLLQFKVDAVGEARAAS